MNIFSCDNIKLFFKSKKIWKLPEEKKVLIYDNSYSNILLRYIKKKDVDIFHNYRANNLVLNIVIILKLLLKGKLNFFNYKKEYLNYVKPKFIITLIDNNYSFYNIKKIYPKAKTIFIQNAHRMKMSDVFSKEIFLKKQKLHVDHMFVFNKFVGKQYNKFIKGNIHEIGSFISNNKRIMTNIKVREFLYISNYKANELHEKILPHRTWKDYFSTEEKLLKNLNIYLTERKKKIHILGASRGDSKFHKLEKEYFYIFFSENNMKFIEKTLSRDNYKIMDQSHIIIGIDSTLAYESLSRGIKTSFFSVRHNDKDFYSTKFGWPARLNSKGPFWTDSYSLKEINRVLDYLNRVEDKTWLKDIGKFTKKLIIRDNQNKYFIKQMKLMKFPVQRQSI